MAHRAQLRRLVEHGGTLHAPTALPTDPELAGGNFLSPTLVTGCPAEICAEAEIFGPCAALLPFDSLEHAVSITNAVPGQLQAYVFSRRPDIALAVARRLVVGLVQVNGVGFGFETTDGEPTFSFWGTAGAGQDGPLEGVWLHCLYCTVLCIVV